MCKGVYINLLREIKSFIHRAAKTQRSHYDVLSRGYTKITLTNFPRVTCCVYYNK